ncbi:MAG TPA: hypothetical protein VN930_03675 [Xanthobacteraceae bacterium]|jgi:hypothetical protein|nr:hypothetical protein [Xanthobacteraceae bacterium]
MQTRYMLLATLLLAGFCAGFATMTKGTDQVVAFSFRQGGTCAVSRDGALLGRVSGARARLQVKKAASTLDLDCSGGGRRLQAKVRPVLAKETIAGAAVSLSIAAVDLISGAAWVYPDRITVDLAGRKVTVPEGWQVE